MNSGHIWHPYTQAKTAAPPINITQGEGATLTDEKGNSYIDAISSWWVSVHGHCRPELQKALTDQVAVLDHVLPAGFTHPKALELSRRIADMLPGGQEHIFFSDNGSTAVEVALKMALQYRHNRGERRKKFVAFRGAYHGDTFGAMAVSDRTAFTAPFFDLLFDTIFIEPPVKGREEAALAQLRYQCDTNGDEITAFIFEPLVQGTAGMVMHEAEPLSRMIKLCREHGILTIADEVMTGFGRTGSLFACNQLGEQPDIVCLSKALTGGMMPMGLTAATAEVYGAFHSDDRSKTFFHGHSYTANPLACAAACAGLDLFENGTAMDDVQRIALNHATFLTKIRHHRLVRAARHKGVILAIEVEGGSETSYFHPLRDRLYHFFLGEGILMRPLGNIIYILPPYCITDFELGMIYQAIGKCLDRLARDIANT